MFQNGRLGNGESVRAAADTIALMQQTLLIQIFRRTNTNSGAASAAAQTAANGREADCPTCQAFSNSCCQVSF